MSDSAGTSILGYAAGRGWLVLLGATLMVASVVTSIVFTEQSRALYTSNRAIMSVGGGLAANGMLGFLRVDLKLLSDQVIRGGGGFAVFLVLFLLNPPAEVAVSAAPKERRRLLARIIHE